MTIVDQKRIPLNESPHVVTNTCNLGLHSGYFDFQHVNRNMYLPPNFKQFNSIFDLNNYENHNVFKVPKVNTDFCIVVCIGTFTVLYTAGEGAK